MNVHVVIPTYNRPDKLAACLASIEAQTHPVTTWVVEDRHRQFAIGIWNELAPTVTDGAFVYICDDVELFPDCIEEAVRVMEAMYPDTDGVIGFNQANIQGKEGTAQSAMGMIGAKFLDRFPDRMPFCPDYSRFHFDSELGFYARSVRRFHFATTARLNHWHPTHYRDKMDETHRVVRDPVEVQEDHRMWGVRRSRGLVWGKDSTLVGRRC